MLKDEIRNIPCADKDLRSFGRVLGIFCAIVGGLSLWKQGAHWPVWLGAAALLLGLGTLWPRALRPFQKVWMTLALLMGWVMTRVLLGLVFFLVLTPIGLLTRLCGKDFMHRRFDLAGSSYWIARPKRSDKSRHETQY